MEELFVVLNVTAETYPLKDISTFLDTFIGIDVQNYCISFEVSADNVQHYHLFFTTSTHPETWRHRFKNEFKFRCRFSSTNVRDRVRAIAYTIKDGSYCQRNIDVSDFLKAVQVSHQKKPKYELALSDIDDRFIAGEYDFNMYISKLIQLNLDYRRKTYKQHIIAHATTIRMIAQQDFKYKYIDSILKEFSYY